MSERQSWKIIHNKFILDVRLIRGTIRCNSGRVNHILKVNGGQLDLRDEDFVSLEAAKDLNDFLASTTIWVTGMRDSDCETEIIHNGKGEREAPSTRDR